MSRLQQVHRSIVRCPASVPVHPAVLLRRVSQQHGLRRHTRPPSLQLGREAVQRIQVVSPVPQVNQHQTHDQRQYIFTQLIKDCSCPGLLTSTKEATNLPRSLSDRLHKSQSGWSEGGASGDSLAPGISVYRHRDVQCSGFGTTSLWTSDLHTDFCSEVVHQSC